MIRIGVRAHDLGKLPAAELAACVASHHLTCVQLAPDKAITGIVAETDILDPALAQAVAAAFCSRGVRIAVLGCYINPIHPDSLQRKSLLARFKRHLRFARNLGCGVVALESGSLNADYTPHPGNHGEEAFQKMLASLAELVEAAEAVGVCVGLEAVLDQTVSTPRKMRRVLDALPSTNLQVVYDPVNLLAADNFRDQERLIGESLELFGDRIVAVHAKDYRIVRGEFQVCAAGTGMFCYGTLFRRLKERLGDTSMILEGASATEVPGCLAFLLDQEANPPVVAAGRSPEGEGRATDEMPAETE